jgi:hypothetical protein
MNKKFRAANGLTATLRWIKEVKAIARSCREDCIDHCLHGTYAVITIEVEGEPVHFIQWINKASPTTAKRIIDIWNSDSEAPSRVHWAVYRERAYSLLLPAGQLLLNSVKRKISPGVNLLVHGELA